MSNIFSSQEANVVHYPGDTAQAPLLAALPLLQCQSWHLGTEDILPTVCDVQEPIRIFVVLVHLRHESSSCGGEDAIHEDEDCLLWGEPKTLPNHVHKLSDCQFLRNQVPVSSKNVGSENAKRGYFLRSISGMSLPSARSQITGMRSQCFLRILSASSTRLSVHNVRPSSDEMAK
eukprot:TRINITY_DN2031_c0_g1_i2.p1 TRINITY_DN2031_c0_g1~~TRINITY_DN2031_c0_g1_i2.p1  ORF type:complete len:175 (+),score=0.71 TRINITY_DN2031_c0_g1_i2:206-730(+)